MKSFILSLSIASLLLCACKKENSTKVEYTVSAQKNNTAWVAKNPYTGFVNATLKDSILIIARIGEETLGIKFKSKGAGTYLQPDVNAYFYTTVGLDVLVSEYKLSNNATNKLIINNYDEAGNTMQGSFNLTFQKTRGDSKYFPDNIVFTNGMLKAQIRSVNTVY